MMVKPAPHTKLLTLPLAVLARASLVKGERQSRSNDVRAGKLIHGIIDNYATHKHPKVRAWLARHPRWVFAFTPTSCSWINSMEGFFSALTRRRLKRGIFRSIVDLKVAINHYLAEHNDNPKPFVWAKPAKTILNRLPVSTVSLARGKPRRRRLHRSPKA